VKRKPVGAGKAWKGKAGQVKAGSQAWPEGGTLDASAKPPATATHSLSARQLQRMATLISRREAWRRKASRAYNAIAKIDKQLKRLERAQSFPVRTVGVDAHERIET
jgi:hypothetical protein